jgi:hypothetical protein
MRHAPVAAIYYLVGGEATQEALYQQHLEYLNTHFGISIQSPTLTGQWIGPLQLPSLHISQAISKNYLILLCKHISTPFTTSL